MRHIVDPRQTRLFDPYERIFSKLAYRRIREGWQGVFRHVILETMPVDTIAGEFSEREGRPTKELYSMAGLVFIMQFHNWTIEQAVDEYMLNSGVQYALNLQPGGQSLSPRTLDRYLAIFREHEIAAKVFREVTAALVGALEKDVSRQRLDSTHVFSNMAIFGRTRLMGVAVKRFLTQVRRHVPCTAAAGNAHGADRLRMWRRRLPAGRDYHSLLSGPDTDADSPQGHHL